MNILGVNLCKFLLNIKNIFSTFLVLVVDTHSFSIKMMGLYYFKIVQKNALRDQK